MPYKDPERQAAAQRRYRTQRIEQAREKERLRKQAARAIKPQKQYYRRKKRPFRWGLDQEPEHARTCNYRFFTTNPCRARAVWLTNSSSTRYCDEHAADHEGGLRRIED